MSVDVDVDVDAYALNYGRTDDYTGYTADLVKASAAQRFEALGWGTVDGAPDL